MKCLVDGCEGVSKERGLCRKCYASACRAVASGVVSWHRLESIGMALPDRFWVMLEKNGIVLPAVLRQSDSIHCRVLQFIAENGGEASRRDIMRRFKLRLQTAEEIADLLESQGRIEIVPVIGIGRTRTMFRAIEPAVPADVSDANSATLPLQAV